MPLMVEFSSTIRIGFPFLLPESRKIAIADRTNTGYLLSITENIYFFRGVRRGSHFYANFFCFTLRVVGNVIHTLRSEKRVGRVKKREKREPSRETETPRNELSKMTHFPPFPPFYLMLY